MFAANSPSESAHGWPGVSVILTVINEAAHLKSAITAIFESGYPGEIEIAIAVGPSKDGTLEIAKALTADPRIRVVDNPSGRTPDGLNSAIAATKNELLSELMDTRKFLLDTFAARSRFSKRRER